MRHAKFAECNEISPQKKECTSCNKFNIVDNET